MQKSVHILLIEDDHEDVELFEEIVKAASPSHHLRVISDGGAFIEYLKNSGSLPDMIVMDLNLPKMHGREILKAIKTNDLYKSVPVAILTTSSAPEDKDYSMKMVAVDYFVKPNTIRELQEIVTAILNSCG